MKSVSYFEIFFTALRLGCISFGGPIAHLAYFRDEYVTRKKWLGEKAYADLIALSQFLPGPASSQTGIAIGMMRGGIGGGVLAWLGFTLPSAIILTIFALLLQNYDIGTAGWVQGLKIVAVAVVAHAILGMGKTLAPDRLRATIAILTAVFLLIWPQTIWQICLLIVAGFIGWLVYNPDSKDVSEYVPRVFSKRVAAAFLAVFFILLALLPYLRLTFDAPALAQVDSYYRAGSLVFGGGHVVLPLLEREVIPAGWVDQDTFIAGYGATQAVPGPLFTFATYLGAATNGVATAMLVTIAIFLPSFLLIGGLLPFWDDLRRRPKIRAALMGVNAGVIGILLAVLYDPLWTSAIIGLEHFLVGLFCFAILQIWKLPAWVVVIAGIAFGAIWL